jgi:uncharacterized GH25 family protein
MNHRLYRALLACFFCLAALASSAHAHFVWLDATNVEGQTYAVLFFSEGPSERDYHLPESLSDVRIFARSAKGDRVPVSMEKKDEDNFIGLRSTAAWKEDAALETTVEYGVYHGSRLVYYAKHLKASTAEALADLGRSPELKFDLVPRFNKDGVTITALWDGKPVKGVTITLSDPDGVPTEETTDENGEAAFEITEPGLVSVIANWTDDKDKGKIDEAAYGGTMHFATLTFQFAPAAE